MLSAYLLSDYDWGTATFSHLLGCLRLVSSGQQHTSMITGFWPFLLFWAYETLASFRPLSSAPADTFPRALRWVPSVTSPLSFSSLNEARIQIDILCVRDVTGAPFNNLEDEHFKFLWETARYRQILLGPFSWEAYLGERSAFRFTGRMRIPLPLPFTFFDLRCW